MGYCIVLQKDKDRPCWASVLTSVLISVLTSTLTFTLEVSGSNLTAFISSILTSIGSDLRRFAAFSSRVAALSSVECHVIGIMEQDLVQMDQVCQVYLYHWLLPVEGLLLWYC